MSLFEEHNLNERQRNEARKLPVQQRVVLWTDEEKENFSKEQMFLVECKVNGATYSTLREYFNLGCDNAVSTALTRTALGYIWKPHVVGGSLAYKLF